MNNATVIQDNMKIISVVLAPLKNKIRSNKKFVDTLLHILDGVTDFRNVITPHLSHLKITEITV